MARKKHQQTKSKKKEQVQTKKCGKKTDVSQFRVLLDALGLQIVQVISDGNCFFRALADQLEGSEEDHGKYRAMVVEYIMKNREMFEPFIEDDVPFNEYCQSMEKDGTWAGNMELQASSIVTGCNICIHRNMSPRWYIRNFDDGGARMVHLSYHDEVHYNSVRLKDDPCHGPARPITIKADAALSVTCHDANAPVSKCNGKFGNDTADKRSIELVMERSGLENAEKVEQVLLQVGGDVYAAIEFLLEDLVLEVYSAETDSLICNGITRSDGDEDKNLKQQKQDHYHVKEAGDMHNKRNQNLKQQKQDHHVKETSDMHNKRNHDDEQQKIPRNKSCSCGSKKKYKSCCGTGKGKPPVKIAINVAESKKGTKERKHSGRRGPANSMPFLDTDLRPPDLGALCI